MIKVQKFLDKEYAQRLGELDTLLIDYVIARKQLNITSLRTVHKVSEQLQDFDEGKRIYKETLSLIN